MITRPMFFLAIALELFLLGAWLTGKPVAAQATSPETAAALDTTVLYDGSLGTLPGNQGFTFVAVPLGPTQMISDGGTILDTTAANDYYAGYFGRQELMPVLDRTRSFTVSFNAQVLDEAHSSPDRAGFSVIILADDAGGTESPLGIELAFWADEIWAQDDGSEGGTLFTHAEGVAFDTVNLTDYAVVIDGDVYALLAGGTQRLSGPLRDYSNFSGFPDPYETPNFLFLGDDTSSARGRVKLDYVAIAVREGVGNGRKVYLPAVVTP